MLDPLSPLNVPPPRYLLESDSSDEEGQGVYPSGSRPRIVVPSPVVRVHTTQPGSETEYDEVIVGLGQAGRYLLKKAGVRAKGGREGLVVELDEDRRRIGEGYVSGAGSRMLLINLDETVGHESTWRITEEICRVVKAKSWTVISTYVPSMYIPFPTSPSPIDEVAPVRCLRVSGPSVSLEQLAKADLAGFDSPNYFTGFAGAFATLASHPAYSFAGSMTLLSLPLPLSSLSDSSLLSALSLASLPAAQVVKEHLQQHPSAAVWSETNDEAFYGPGMGGMKNGKARTGGTISEDVGTMYM